MEVETNHKVLMSIGNNNAGAFHEHPLCLPDDFGSGYSTPKVSTVAFTIF